MALEEGKTRSLIGSLPDGFAYHRVVTDEKGNPIDYIFLEVNPAFEKMTGLSKEKALGKKVTELLPGIEEDSFNWIENLGKIGIEGGSGVFQKYSDYFQKWYELSVSGVEKGYFGVIFREITREKEIEKSLKSSEEKYKALVNQSLDMLFLHDQEGQILEVNREAVKRTGYSREQLLNMTVFDLHPDPGGKDWIIPEWKSWKVGNGPIRIEDYHIHSDGSIVPVEIATGKVSIGDGEYILALVSDISERKQFEKDLRKSEEDLRTTLNSIGDAVIATDPDGKIVRMNPVAEDLTGWEEEKAKGKPLTEVFRIFNSQTGDKVENPVEKVIQSKKMVGLANHTMLVSKGGEKYQIADSAAPIYNPEGEITGVVLVFRDITEEYRLQEEVKKNRERLDFALSAANDGIWDWDLAENTVYFDPRYFTMAGYEPDEFSHSFEDWEKRVHPEDIEEAKKAIKSHLSGDSKEFKTEFRFRRKDGTWMWVLSRAKILEKDEKGKPLRMVGTHTEITNRKNAEEELRRQKQRLANIIEGTDVGTWEWNVKTGENLVNEKWAEIIGYTLEEISPVTIETWRRFVYPEDLKKCEKMLEKHLKGELDIFDTEYRMKHKNGELVWIQDRGKVISWTEDGDPLWVFGTHLDITERKETEKALKENEEKLNLMARNYHDVVIETDINGVLKYLSPSHKKVLGRGEEVLGHKLFDFIHPDDLPKVFDGFGKTIETGEETRLELRYMHPEKGYIWVESIGSTYKNRSNETVLLTTTRDISERKKMEQEVLQGKNLIEGVFNSIQDGMSVLNPDLTIRKVNKAMERWYKESVPLEGKKCYEVFQNREEPCNPCPSLIALETGEMQVETVFLKGINEEVGWIESYSYPFIDPQGNTVGIVEFIRDITDRKKAEETIRKTKIKVERLHEKTLQMSLAQEEEKVYQLIVEAAEEILNFRLCVVDIVEADHFVVKATSGDLPAEGARNMPITEGIAGQCYQKGKTILINDLWESKEGKPIKRSYRALLSTPIGKMGIFQAVSTQKDFFTNEDVNLAEILISHASEAIKRIRSEKDIRYLSFHDNLTGLYNRTFLEQEIKRLDLKKQNPVSIIMGDINGLKLVNDAYGHAEGDKLLKKASDILKKLCRQEDMIARWGGDEFVILLPQTSLFEANLIASRIMNESRIFTKETIPLSIALGVASKENNDEDIFEILALAEKRMYRNKLSESRSARSAVLTSLIKTLEEKSQETEEHTYRMGAMAQMIGKEIGLLEEELNRLNLLVSLHDIGKIIISEEILNKPERLTEEEWKLVQAHPETGYRIARSTDEIAHVAEEILSHHERWDGKGYPRGLSGKNIPLLSRINAIVDAYDVMTNGRPYKKPMSKKEAIEELKRCAGTQFDPELVKVFIDIISKGEK